MGLLTTEHSRPAYFADVIVYGATSVAMASFLAVTGPRDRWPEIVSSAALGLLAWTIVEYGLHRFVLHRLQPFRGWHAEHHRRPRALIGTPTVVSATSIAAMVFLPALLLSDLWRASALTFGFLTGYLIYAIAHHATHHWHAGSEWTRRRKRAHALHHSPVGPPGHYGVTSDLWDVVFRTNGSGDAASAAAADAIPLEIWEDEGGALAVSRHRMRRRPNCLRRSP